jgi:glycosyltransferase involved in cell wall biosynthesis
MIPLVSVVIPCFNYGRFLPEAVDSVLSQGVTDLEVIIVDDGSTDETPEVVARLTDPRIRAYRFQNGGNSAARNHGIELARGEFLAFLDADDRWLPGKLERQLALLEAEPGVGMVFTDFRRFDDHGSSRRPSSISFRNWPGFPSDPRSPAGESSSGTHLPTSCRWDSSPPGSRPSSCDARRWPTCGSLRAGSSTRTGTT